jgi:DNA-binding transcriptional ArsR family regulator
MEHMPCLYKPSVDQMLRPLLALLNLSARQVSRRPALLLANENRLLVLCRLVVAGEMSVGDLAEAVDLSQSALSQHLAKMREDGLVVTRREAQTVFYRIANPNAARLLALLKNIYCP